MKYFLFFLFILLTPQIALAADEYVNRTITYTDIPHKILNITITPSPYEKFSFPGYFITEYLPNDVSFMGTDADWYKLNGSQLSLMKFNPSSSNYTINYTIRITVDSGTVTFYGTYKDENRTEGEIPAQSIVFGQATVTPAPTSSSGNNADDTGVDNPIKSIDVMTISALQQAYIAETDLVENRAGILYAFIIILLIIGYGIVRKIKNRPEKFKFTDEFLKDHEQ